MIQQLTRLEIGSTGVVDLVLLTHYPIDDVAPAILFGFLVVQPQITDS